MIAVLDACVLFPAPIRDLFMHLALLDMFQAKWTEQIHEEWIRNLLRVRPDLSRRQLNRTRDLMNSHVRDCLVSGHESLLDDIELPDQDDRHVVAAAIHCGAEVIVTFNIRDFPSNAIKKYGLLAIPPDEFIIGLAKRDHEKVMIAFERQLASLRNPTRTRSELTEAFRKLGLKKTARLIERGGTIA